MDIVAEAKKCEKKAHKIPRIEVTFNTLALFEAHFEGKIALSAIFSYLKVPVKNQQHHAPIVNAFLRDAIRAKKLVFIKD